MSFSTLLLIIVALLLFGSIPSWPYSRRWGYAPSGALGFILLVVAIVLLARR